jgi:hypothetical protein
MTRPVMTAAGDERGEIALIEAHDAKIDTVVLRTDQTCVIHFRHLAVYHARAAEDFAIWSYRAFLELRGVDHFLWEGGSPTTDYVSDAFVFRDDAAIDWTRLLQGSPSTRIEMTFGSGRRIDIRCCEAQLTLQEPLKHFEDWHGPL